MKNSGIIWNLLLIFFIHVNGQDLAETTLAPTTLAGTIAAETTTTIVSNPTNQATLSVSTEATTTSSTTVPTEPVATTTTTTTITITTAAPEATEAIVPVQNEVEQFDSSEPPLSWEAKFINAVESCEYGENPSLTDICQLDDIVTFQKWNDVIEAIIDKGLVEKLEKQCHPGEWCLDHDIAAVSDLPIGSQLLRRYGEELCSIFQCYEDIVNYISSCSPSLISRLVAGLLPIACEVKQVNWTSNEVCTENIVKLVHITAANTVENAKKEGDEDTLFWTCADIFDKEECAPECKNFAEELLRIDDCCQGSALFLSQFWPWAWYYVNPGIVKDICELPDELTCGAAFSIFARTEILVGMILTVCVILVVILVLLFWSCCKFTILKIRQKAELYDYARIDGLDERVSGDSDSEENPFQEPVTKDGKIAATKEKHRLLDS